MKKHLCDRCKKIYLGKDFIFKFYFQDNEDEYSGEWFLCLECIKDVKRQLNKMETCIYDRANKVPATKHCCKCGLPLCSSCGYIDPPAEIKNKKLVIPENSKNYCNECWQKKERAKNLSVYYLYIKSHCEAPDFEAEMEATSKKEALKLFREQYGRQLCEFDDDFLLAKIGVIN